MLAGDAPIYRDLMRFKPEGWTDNAWAVRAGVSRTVWTDMRRHGNPSRRTLEKLLIAAGSSLAEFEALRVGEAFARDEDIASGVTEPSGSPWHSGALPALPLISSSSGGTLNAQGTRIDLTDLRAGAMLERLPRPASLAGDPGAYALAVVSDAMWPRFRRGRRIAISPKAGVEPGDDVLVTVSSQPDGRSLAFVAELVRQSAAGAEFRQFNPGVTFAIPADQFACIAKVMGELF